MTIEELKSIEDEVYVTFKYSRHGLEQYYTTRVKGGKIVGELPKLIAHYDRASDAVDFNESTTLDELIATIKEHSFLPESVSIHLINGVNACLYFCENLETSLEKALKGLDDICIEFINAEILDDLKKCNHAIINNIELDKTASNADEILYKLNCKAYWFMYKLGIKEYINLNGEFDPMNGTGFLDELLLRTTLKIHWM